MSIIIYTIVAAIGNIIAFLFKKVVFPLIKWILVKGKTLAIVVFMLTYIALTRMSEHTGNDKFSDENIQDVVVAYHQCRDDYKDSIRSIEGVPYLADTVLPKYWKEFKSSHTYEGFVKDFKWIGKHLDNIAETSNTYKGIKKDIKK